MDKETKDSYVWVNNHIFPIDEEEKVTAMDDADHEANCRQCKHHKNGLIGSDVFYCDKFKESFDFYKECAFVEPNMFAFETVESDNIDPEHYNQYEIEPIDFIMQNKLEFCEANVVKYVVRHREKNGAEDIKKAIQYCEFILEKEYKENK